MTSAILLARDGPVAKLTLNRPASLNALDAAMMDELVAHTTALAADDTLRCVVIRGAGKHFMAGGDIRHFAEQLALAPADRRERFMRTIEHLHVAIEQLQRMAHPVVASVHGAVAGFGLSLLCACDLAIAADTSYFTSAYRQLGVTPDGGLSYALPRQVGLKKAMEILLLGERFGADDALRVGLVNRVVPEAELDRATAAVVAAIVSGPVAAMRNGKRLIHQSLAQTLSAQLGAEAASFGACSATDDFVEGVRAFLDKRPPRFGGADES
ncbi:MAG: enoyl-CoA hydratase-related protein [Pseudomonadota bacterium]|nr:enoyl-CoA hydratase-related protein [Pseudomonadota bacterium]